MATEPLFVMIGWPDALASRETWVQHLHDLTRLPRNAMGRDIDIASARKIIASIDRHTADPSTSEIYDVLMDPVGPDDTRERWEQHLRGLMRLPQDMLGRKEMIVRARTMIAEKARQAPDSPRERKLAKADAKKAKAN